jgi:hypothetical protein
MFSRQIDKFLKSIGLSRDIENSPQGIFRAAQQVGAEAARREQESLTGPNEAVRVTDGVHWQLQSIGIGGAPGTRWFSSNLKTQAGFLFIAQKVAGQSQPGFLASLNKALYKQSLALYGFDNFDTPDLPSAKTYPLPPAVDTHFMALTSNEAEARQLLNPWAQKPLANWGTRYPLKQFQTQSDTRFSQIVILFSPNGLHIATPGVLKPDQAEEISMLGVELIKAQGTP